MISITIPGTPLAQSRPRFNRKTGCVFDPQGAAKNTLKVLAKSKMLQNGFKMLSEAIVRVDMIAYSYPPRSWPQKRLKCAEGTYKETKPDVDNISKLYLDVLNGIAYHDDKQVACLHVEKRYSDIPRVEITITEIRE